MSARTHSQVQTRISNATRRQEKRHTNYSQSPGGPFDLQRAIASLRRRSQSSVAGSTVHRAVVCNSLGTKVSHFLQIWEFACATRITWIFDHPILTAAGILSYPAEINVAFSNRPRRDSKLISISNDQGGSSMSERSGGGRNTSPTFQETVPESRVTIYFFVNEILRFRPIRGVSSFAGTPSSSLRSLKGSLSSWHRPGWIVDLPARKWSDPARIMLVRDVTLKLPYVARWRGPWLPLVK